MIGGVLSGVLGIGGAHLTVRSGLLAARPLYVLGRSRPWQHVSDELFNVRGPYVFIWPYLIPSTVQDRLVSQVKSSR